TAWSPTEPSPVDRCGALARPSPTPRCANSPPPRSAIASPASPTPRPARNCSGRPSDRRCSPCSYQSSVAHLVQLKASFSLTSSINASKIRLRYSSVLECGSLFPLFFLQPIPLSQAEP